MLLIGPPGSGKTHYVLERLEAAIRAARGSQTKLIVPTASMARHLLHTLARRGLVVPVDVIQTVRDFVRRLTPDLQEPTVAANSWLIERATQAANRKEFSAISETPGFRRYIERTVREFQAAGCDATTLGRLIRTPQQAAFAAVFFEYEKLLDKHGYIDAAGRFALAAAEVRRRGLGDLREVYVDGFFYFSHGERQLVSTLAELAERVVITAWPDADPGFPGMRRRHLRKLFRAAVEPLVAQAPSPEREVEEIARRIIAERRPFEQIGIILRAPEVYGPLIRRVFERFHIPFHLRMPEPLDRDGTIRFLTSLLACIAQGFPAEETLGVLSSPICRAGLDPQMDAFDFREREGLGDDGLGFLRARAKDYPVVRKQLDELSALARRRGAVLSPEEWAERCRSVARQWVRLPKVEDGQCVPAVRELRRQALALSSFDAASLEAAQLLKLGGAGNVRLVSSLRVLDAVLSQTLAEPVDQRRDGVHVLTAYEARQWELPLVFVCGLVENQFPRHHSEDLLFSSSDRERLQGQGLHLRTAKDLDQEELLLFRIATSRATEKLFVTYPRADKNGRPLLRSFFLDGLEEKEVSIPTVRVHERPADYRTQRPTSMSSPELLEAVVEKHDHFSPSSLEHFLQCPYQFFARQTLELETRPPPPDQRIDPLLMGTIIHRTIAQWTGDSSQAISAVFDRVFDETCEKAGVWQNFRTALIRTNMLADLERYAREESEASKLELKERKTEEKFEYMVDDGEHVPFRISGRIDRYDVLEGNLGLIVDYKYSGEGRIRKLVSDRLGGANVQAQIYLLGLEREKGIRPAGIRFWGLRNKTTVRGWVAKDLLPAKAILENDTQLPETEFRDMLAQGEGRIVRTIDEIRGGRIEVAPADRDFCKRVCLFRDVCRIEL